ncbi:hypothetical protein Pmani_004138 [Petrolisthes manimaculis]|uniref:Pro-resilin n=1 Tax=Petrolisthes manimaculis TaxID=1843537 RepID=A0AAE1UIT4_9EUCA|nr:hypothetical protein Pmani_004138 [Petrolisthes manimaculis]
MFQKIVLVALVAVAVADRPRPSYSPPRPSYSPPAPSYNAPAPSYRQPEPVGPAQYDFNWAVNDDYSGNNFGHQETRDGYNTQGSYYVQLPDGRLQRVAVVCAVVGMAVCAQLPSYNAPAPSYNAPRPSYASQEPSGPAQYDFNWNVKDEYSGNDFGHNEGRDGYDTQGTYYVQLPDGRLQRVTYYVNGDSGYVAEVSYEGEAQYPAYQPVAPAPSYRPGK